MGARPVPGGEPSEHSAVRRVPRVRVQAVGDEHGNYRGLYEWDGPERAESYTRSLWRVLELVSAPNSMDYEILPKLRRDDVLADPGVLDRFDLAVAKPDWWRPVAPNETDREPKAQAVSKQDAE